jgi:hypothetical protein
MGRVQVFHWEGCLYSKLLQQVSYFSNKFLKQNNPENPTKNSAPGVGHLIDL